LHGCTTRILLDLQSDFENGPTIATVIIASKIVMARWSYRLSHSSWSAINRIICARVLASHD